MLTDSINQPNVFNDKEINVKIYPNPTKGSLKIEIPSYKNNEEIMLSLYDMTGKMYLTTKKKESHINLDLSNFPKGVYILRMHRGDKYSSWRIIKID